PSAHHPVILSEVEESVSAKPRLFQRHRSFDYGSASAQNDGGGGFTSAQDDPARNRSKPIPCLGTHPQRVDDHVEKPQILHEILWSGFRRFSLRDDLVEILQFMCVWIFEGRARDRLDKRVTDRFDDIE